MKPILTFKIGSSYFFDKFEDYKVKDCDELCIMDHFSFPGTNVLNMKKDEKDVFFYRDMDKEGFIRDTIESNVPMRVGKFLNPEFSEHLGMKTEDLKRLEPVFRRLDDKHSYEMVIFEAYVSNGNFRLTDEQLADAYAEYKRKRPETYGNDSD